MVKSINEAAEKYARDMAEFLGVPPEDVQELAERYKQGMENFAKNLEEMNK